MRERILITGTEGRIGRSIVPLLREEFALRLFDVLPVKAVADDETVQGDIRDFEAIRQACVGVKTLVHLAAISNDDDFSTRLLPMNLLGVQVAFEAARHAGVKKVIFASTGQTVMGYGWETKVTRDMPVRPVGAYAATKIFGEAMARLYADKFGMSMICLRIGAFHDYDSKELRAGRRVSQIWISPRDLTQIITKSIRADVPFAIFFAISNNATRTWDYSNANELVGYEPQNNSAEYCSGHSQFTTPR